MPEVIGITLGFLTAEALSMLLALTPTGVTQLLAAFIQLVLTAFGAAGMIVASIEAIQHGRAWLTTAWTAEGKPDQISEASREFARMIVAIAAAALAYIGAKGNFNNAIKIASNMPTGGLPALAIAGGGQASAGVGTGVVIGPTAGGPALGGVAALRLADKDQDALGHGPEAESVNERDMEKSRKKELHEKRAAEGPKKRAASGKRTELAEHIPPPGDAFVEWFDSLTLAELDELLANQVKGVRDARDIIEYNIRHPRGRHEWLMVAEARQFKEWGVSMKEIYDGRTFTKATMGKNFRHGSTGSDTFHKQLRAMVHSSGSYEEFLDKLNRWADNELVPSHSPRFAQDLARGRYSLPENLQRRVRP